nr:hypothetical protein [uncultured Gellertiella sp.]
MVPDEASANDMPKDDPDILDLKANPAGDAKAPEAASFQPEVPAPEPVAAARAEKSQSLLALMATGAFGGLVALAAAGTLQHAGYLPGLSPAAPAASTDTDLAALRQEIDGVRQQLAGIPADLAPNAALEQRIADLEAKGGSGTTDPALAGTVKTLQQTVADLSARAGQYADGASQQFAALSDRLATAEKTLKDQPGEAAVSKAIAATYLKAAVDRGDPFLTELQTFASLSPEDPAIPGLKGMAAAGVRSKAALAADFDAVAKSAIDAVNQPTAGEGMLDRLLASARSLVSVRPVGNVEGSDAGAILARMEDKLRNGDIKGASLEWDALPAPAKAATADFKAALDRRATADELTRGLAGRSATPAVNAG